MGQMTGVVAHQPVFQRGNRPVDQLHAKSPALLHVVADRLRTLLRVPQGDDLRDGRGIGQAQPEQPRIAVAKQRLYVVGDGIALRLPSWVMTLQT